MKPPTVARFTKAISSDGNECRDLPEYRETREELEVSCTLSIDQSGAERRESFVRAANETVSSFLKSLAMKEEHEEITTTTTTTTTAAGAVSGFPPIVDTAFKGDEEDGKFRIGDIHDTGGYSESQSSSVDSAGLKRSQSTGDMDAQDGNADVFQKPDFGGGDNGGGGGGQKAPVDDDVCSSAATTLQDSVTLQDISDNSESTTTAHLPPLPPPPPPPAAKSPCAPLSPRPQQDAEKEVPPKSPTTTRPKRPGMLSSKSAAAISMIRPKLLRQECIEIHSDDSDNDGPDHAPLVRSYTTAAKPPPSPKKKKEALFKANKKLDELEPIRRKREPEVTFIEPRDQADSSSQQPQQAATTPKSPSASTKKQEESVGGKQSSSSSSRRSSSGSSHKKGRRRSSPDSGSSSRRDSVKYHHTLPGKSSSGKKGKKKRPSLTITIDNTGEKDPSTIITTADGDIISSSPTLHISGVSISRSPGGAQSDATVASAEPSPGLTVTPAAGTAADPANRSSRSSSLVVPPPTPSRGGAAAAGAGCCCKHNNEKGGGSRSMHVSRECSPLCSPRRGPASAGRHEDLVQTGASKFMFPPPPQDAAAFTAALSSALQSEALAGGPLSSVLHVHDSNLSSDDFHEALFLGKSPTKAHHHKKRRRSKKRAKEAVETQQAESNQIVEEPVTPPPK